MVFTQANVKDTPVGRKSGERVMIEEIADKELPLVYAPDLAEQRIKHEILVKRCKQIEWRSVCAGSCRCGAIRISQNALPVLVSRRSRARGARSTGRKP